MRLFTTTAWCLTAILLAGGCDDEASSHGPGGPPLPSAPVRLDESLLVARVQQGQVVVSGVVEQAADVAVRGTVHVVLRSLEPIQEEPAATATAEFDTSGGSTEVQLEPAVDLSDEAGPALVAWTLDYRLRVDGHADLEGTRSLWEALAKLEAQVLAPDLYDVGAPSALRIIVRDPDSGRAVAGAAVRVRYLPRNEGEAASLWFQGETDELGLSVADVQPEEADLGDGRLEVQVDAGPAGRVAIQAPARVGRARRILLTTDKPLYQPSQTIHLRALVLGRADRGGRRRQPGGRPGGRPGGPRPWPTRSTAAWDRRWAGSGSSRTSSSTRTCPAR